jgi:hypothetical protein
LTGPEPPASLRRPQGQETTSLHYPARIELCRSATAGHRVLLPQADRLHGSAIGVAEWSCVVQGQRSCVTSRLRSKDSRHRCQRWRMSPNGRSWAARRSQVGAGCSAS